MMHSSDRGWISFRLGPVCVVVFGCVLSAGHRASELPGPGAFAAPITMSATATHIAVDPQAIEDLRALNPEDPQFLRELVDLFIQDVPDRIAEIDQALAAKDAALLTRAAHTIKGSCSNFGAGRLKELSHAIELHGKASAFAEAAAALPALRAEFETVTVALKQVA